MSSEKQPPARPPPPASQGMSTQYGQPGQQQPPEHSMPPPYPGPQQQQPPQAQTQAHASPYSAPAYAPPAPASSALHVSYTGRSQVDVLPREAGAVEHAMKQQAPSLQSRVDLAAGKHVPLVVDLDAILDVCPDGRTRLLTVENLFVRALPKFVDAFEDACRDELVRADVLAQIGGGIQVRNVSAAPPTKGTALMEGRLQYTGTFEAGNGFFTTKQWRDFFEKTFYAEERYLLGRLRNEVMPALQHQLDSRMHRHVPLIFDPYAVVAQLTGRERLETARLLAEDAGFERSARKFTQTVDSWFGGSQAKDPQSKDPVRSQNLLLPLVTAVLSCVEVDPSNPVLATLSSIEVRPCSSLEQKCIYLADSAGNNIPPSAMHKPNAPSTFSLVYVGAFHKGLVGLVSSKDINALLEAATRAEERGLMNTLINVVAVELQTELTTNLQHPVSVEFSWETIFPPELPAGERHDIARTLGANKSRNVVQPVIQAFKDIFRANPECVKAMQFVNRMVIKSADDSTRPELEVVQDDSSGHQSLVYTAALGSGLSGCFDKHQLKQRVRTLFQLSTPKEDRGLGGALQSVAGGIDRAGDKLARQFKKFGF